MIPLKTKCKVTKNNLTVFIILRVILKKRVISLFYKTMKTFGKPSLPTNGLMMQIIERTALER